MKIRDFMDDFYRFTENSPEHYSKTCDNLKAGDPDRDVEKIALSMFATPAVIRSSSEWGANLLIVHEPVFYSHWDDLSDLENFPEPQRSLVRKKQELIRKSGLTIYRFHDHPHYREPDYVSMGETARWGLKGTWKRGAFTAVNNFILDHDIPVLELAETLEKNLDIQRIRIFGSRKTICRKLSLCFGTPGHLMEELEQNDVVLTGEICEWNIGQMAGDYFDLLGESKSILVMGHIGSEREGMRLMEKVIKERYSQFEVKYFECGECFSFTH